MDPTIIIMGCKSLEGQGIQKEFVIEKGLHISVLKKNRCKIPTAS